MPMKKKDQIYRKKKILSPVALKERVMKKVHARVGEWLGSLWVGKGRRE